ncbi:MAG TPA: hypothetical protein VN442_18970 [Bryobacteraceae bacterium]|nr:hypothetical protein [Bryobacteraceae bacterium]
MTILRNLWMEESGQDLIEYSLLLAFVCLASAAILTSTGSSITGIWTKTQGKLAAADSAIN